MARAPEKLQSSGAWRQIEAEFLATGRAAPVLQGLTEATDAIAREAYQATIGSAWPGTAAMLAVGAYGRGETFPYSGADIVILLDSTPSESAKDALAGFARLLWDAGLRLNYTARTVAECLEAREQTMELTVNLLDRRFLAGDASLQAEIESRMPAALARHTRRINQYLCYAARTRHAKYRNTCHHLEPDVKDGPGGLRDLRLIDWLAKLNPEHQPPLGQLDEAAAYVSAARCFLHYHAGRDGNVLGFDAQETVAGQPFAQASKPLEWMRDYFRHARAIYTEARRALDRTERSHSSLLENFHEYRTRLSNAEFTVARERLLLRSPAHLDNDPGLVLRMLEFIGRHGVAPAPDTERRLEAARPRFTAWCAQPRPLWSELRSILSCPNAAMALRALENAGLLPALFPEWAHIEDLPAADAERRYTADEHTLTAIESVEGLRSAPDPPRRQFCELLSQIDEPPLLLFALLFHDTGRDEADPLRAAAERARAAMARIQMPAEEQRTIEFLIGHQHDLSAAMGGRDIQDPATARLLAEHVGTVERLKLLAVMTYAGISAAHPEAMTPWRLEQLSRAYSVTHRELTRELETDRIQQAPGALPEVVEFIQGFPTRYLRAHSPDEIEAHFRLFELSRPAGAAVQLDSIEGAYRLTAIARDRPYLFASFAAAMTSFGMDILKAEAFSNIKGVILDSFVFADPKRMLQQNPPEIERLRDLVRRVALGKTDAQRLMRNLPRPELKRRAHPPQAQFDSDACETATLVEIVAEDRPGLLYSLATVFSSSACNIDVVLIDTKGNRAIDVFYVSHEGRKLSPELQARLREKLLAAC